MIYYYLPNKKLIWTLKKQWRINSIKEELRLKVDELAKKHSEAIAKKNTRSHGRQPTAMESLSVANHRAANWQQSRRLQYINLRLISRKVQNLSR